MTEVDVTPDGFVVDATLLADAFGLAPENIHPLMRSGKITSRSETGVDEDAGRSRLTFHYRDRVVRLVVDQSGGVLKQTRFSASVRNSAAVEPCPSPHPEKT